MSSRHHCRLWRNGLCAICITFVLEYVSLGPSWGQAKEAASSRNSAAGHKTRAAQLADSLREGAQHGSTNSFSAQNCIAVRFGVMTSTIDFLQRQQHHHSPSVRFLKHEGFAQYTNCTYATDFEGFLNQTLING